MGTDKADARRRQLKGAADAYFQGLQRRDFDTIPFAEDVRLRAPLAPGGVYRPLVGKPAVRSDWWEPLVPALDGVRIKVLDYYVNEALTANCCGGRGSNRGTQSAGHSSRRRPIHR